VNVKRTLQDVPIDDAAEARAWAVVQAAYEHRVPARVERRRWPLVAASAVGAAVLAAAVLSPPGRAVVDAVRRSIGIEHATPALFRLPAGGRLLVSGTGGAWVVSADGSKRRLGDYRQASWSPHGVFVVAASGDEVAALEPSHGGVHWSLARRSVSFPRWGGTRTDTRVAYLSGGIVRVVGGDGRGDTALAPGAAVAPAWRPESHVLAYATPRRSVRVIDTDSRVQIADHRVADRVRAIAWSPDGARLAVATRREVEIYGANPGRLVLRVRGVQALAFAGDGRLALLRAPGTVLVVGPEGARTILRVSGPLEGLAWSPAGRWLVTALPGADQWVFLDGRHVQAVSHIARQFGGAVSLDGWASGA
jgi:anaphase-promoting complex subunit 4